MIMRHNHREYRETSNRRPGGGMKKFKSKREEVASEDRRQQVEIQEDAAKDGCGEDQTKAI